MAEDPADTSRPIAEISHGPSAFEAFLDRNQKGMIVVGILIVAATAGWIIFRGIKDAAEKSAGAILTRTEALPELQELVKDHPETAAAGSARLLISAKQWEAGDQAAAIETLQSFISSNAGHPALATARASLASRLMQQGKNDEAAVIFRELAEAPDARFIAPYALMSLGDLAKAAGRLDEAEQAYKRAQNDFGTNPFANPAGQHLKLLRFKMPLEIEPPPAPEKKEGEESKPDALDSAGFPKAAGSNPLGNFLGGESEPAPPAEAPPVSPAVEPPAPPASPAGESPPPPAAPEPAESPAEGKSN